MNDLTVMRECTEPPPASRPPREVRFLDKRPTNSLDACCQYILVTSSLLFTQLSARVHYPSSDFVPQSSYQLRQPVVTNGFSIHSLSISPLRHAFGKALNMLCLLCPNGHSHDQQHRAGQCTHPTNARHFIYTLRACCPSPVLRCPRPPALRQIPTI